jgi:hypothetical protein
VLYDLLISDKTIRQATFRMKVMSFIEHIVLGTWLPDCDWPFSTVLYATVWGQGRRKTQKSILFSVDRVASLIV